MPDDGHAAEQALLEHVRTHPHAGLDPNTVAIVAASERTAQAVCFGRYLDDHDSVTRAIDMIRAARKQCNAKKEG